MIKQEIRHEVYKKEITFLLTVDADSLDNKECREYMEKIRHHELPVDQALALMSEMFKKVLNNNGVSPEYKCC